MADRATPGPAGSAHVNRLVALIHQRSGEHLCLRTMSRMLGRQAAYLGRLFKQQMGVTVHEYLARVRMEHAARLIAEGEKIEAVSLEVGYRSRKNFYRQFRRSFDTTPSGYRRRDARAHA